MKEYCPFAEWRPGPLTKWGGYQSGNTNPKRGQVSHSAEGYMAGALSMLDGPTPVSWHFTVGFGEPFDRGILQHYPLTANCWHAGDSDDDGGVRANIDLIGVEHLGKAGEALTEYQIDATVRLTRWCAAQFGLDIFARYPMQDRVWHQLGVWTLAEHNEVSDRPTACPSGRIPWDEILRRLALPETSSPTPTTSAGNVLPSLPAWTQEQLRIGAALAMLTHYRFEVLDPPNVVGQLRLRLLEQNGSISQPESQIAIDPPK